MEIYFVWTLLNSIVAKLLQKNVFSNNKNNM